MLNLSGRTPLTERVESRKTETTVPSLLIIIRVTLSQLQNTKAIYFDTPEHIMISIHQLTGIAL